MCKFLSDLTVKRKALTRLLCVDMRHPDERDEIIGNCDKTKLKEVIENNHGDDEKMSRTDFICKHVLE